MMLWYFIIFALHVPLIMSADTSPMPTSLSQKTEYPAFCLSTAKDETIFQTFRQNIRCEEVIETLCPTLGVQFEKAIVKKYPHLLKYAQKICKDDKVGGPKQYLFRAIGLCSPTILRYLKVAGDLEKEFGSLAHLHIVEIGGGYGGQCKILNDINPFASYTIVDIPEVTPLINKFLSRFNIKNVRTIDNNTLKEPVYADLVISNYAFSECNKREQLHYIKHIINAAPRGYFIYNLVKPVDPLTLKEFVDLIATKHKSVRIESEYPLTGAENLVVIWNSGS